MKRIIILTAAVLLALSSCTTEESPSPSIKSVDYSIYIPESFTPNNDGLNDVFNIVTNNINEDIGCYIYSNNLLIFSSKTKNFQWDGTYKGKDMPTGNYQYRITYTVSSTSEKGVIDNSVFLHR